MIRTGVLACLLVVTPDVLLPGHKGVRHELVLDASAEIDAAWQFIAAPTHGFGVAAIQLGQPFRFSNKYGTRIWAVPKSTEPPGEWREESFLGCPVAATPVVEISSVPVGNPLERVVTSCRVTAVTDDEIRLEVLGERRWDAWGNPLDESVLLALLVGIAAIGVVGLVLLARRRGARAGAGA